MAKKIEKHFPQSPPDLAQHYAEEIRAVIDNPKVLIETRIMPAASNGAEHEWTVSGSGANAITAMLMRENWKEGYEFRVQPPGKHVWCALGLNPYGSSDDPKFGYGHTTATAALDDSTGVRDVFGYLHIEFDPDDPTKMRVCEIVKKEEA